MQVSNDLSSQLFTEIWNNLTSSRRSWFIQYATAIEQNAKQPLKRIKKVEPTQKSIDS